MYGDPVNIASSGKIKSRGVPEITIERFGGGPEKNLKGDTVPKPRPKVYR